MIKSIAAIIWGMGLVSCGPATVKQENAGDVVLPNAKLLGCRSSGCSQLWQDKLPRANDKYPKEMIIDLSSGAPCPLGVEALYDKSTSIEDLKASIDERYGKWAKDDNRTSPVKLWRVEQEKFAIQLAVVDKGLERMTLGQALAQPLGQQEKGSVAEEGMKRVIYLSFPGTKCDSQ